MNIASDPSCDVSAWMYRLWDESKSQSERFVNFRHPIMGHHTRKIWLAALRFQEARGIQGTQLKAQKEGIVGKAGFPGRHPHIGGIISRHISRSTW
jgi:hypothetical protein